MELNYTIYQLADTIITLALKKKLEGKTTYTLCYFCDNNIYDFTLKGSYCDTCNSYYAMVCPEYKVDVPIRSFDPKYFVSLQSIRFGTYHNYMSSNSEKVGVLKRELRYKAKLWRLIKDL